MANNSENTEFQDNWKESCAIVWKQQRTELFLENGKLKKENEELKKLLNKNEQIKRELESLVSQNSLYQTLQESKEQNTKLTETIQQLKIQFNDSQTKLKNIETEQASQLQDHTNLTQSNQELIKTQQDTIQMHELKIKELQGSQNLSETIIIKSNQNQEKVANEQSEVKQKLENQVNDQETNQQIEENKEYQRIVEEHSKLTQSNQVFAELTKNQQDTIQMHELKIKQLQESQNQSETIIKSNQDQEKAITEQQEVITKQENQENKEYQRIVEENSKLTQSNQEFADTIQMHELKIKQLQESQNQSETIIKSSQDQEKAITEQEAITKQENQVNDQEINQQNDDKQLQERNNQLEQENKEQKEKHERVVQKFKNIQKTWLQKLSLLQLQIDQQKQFIKTLFESKPSGIVEQFQLFQQLIESYQSLINSNTLQFIKLLNNQNQLEKKIITIHELFEKSNNFIHSLLQKQKSQKKNQSNIESKKKEITAESEEQQILEIPFLNDFVLTNTKLSDINDQWTFETTSDSESLIDKSFNTIISIFGNEYSGKNYILNLITNNKILENQQYTQPSQKSQKVKDKIFKLYFHSDICFATLKINSINHQENSLENKALQHYLFQFLNVNSQIIIYVIQQMSSFEAQLIHQLESQYPGKIIIIIHNNQFFTKSQAANYMNSVVCKYFKIIQLKNADGSEIYSQPSTPFYHLLTFHQSSKEAKSVNSASSNFIQLLISQLTSFGDTKFFDLFQDYFTNEFAFYVEPQIINNSLTLNKENQLYFEEKTETYQVIENNYNLISKKQINKLIFKNYPDYGYLIKKINQNQITIMVMFYKNETPIKLNHINNQSTGKSTILTLELYQFNQKNETEIIEEAENQETENQEIQVEIENYPSLEQSEIQEYANALEILLNICI